MKKKFFAPSTAHHHEQDALRQTTPFKFTAAGWDCELSHGEILWALVIKFTGTRKQRLNMRLAAADILGAFTRDAGKFNITPVSGGQKVTWERTDLSHAEVATVADSIRVGVYSSPGMGAKVDA